MCDSLKGAVKMYNNFNRLFSDVVHNIFRKCLFERVFVRVEIPKTQCEWMDGIEKSDF